MAILNMIGGGGGDFDIVYKGILTPYDSRYFFLPIAVNGYKVGDILWVKAKNSTTSSNYINEICIYITANGGSTTGTGSSAARGLGMVQLSTGEGQIVSGFFDTYNAAYAQLYYYAYNPTGSVIHTSSSSYKFITSGQYDVALYRRK